MPFDTLIKDVRVVWPSVDGTGTATFVVERGELTVVRAGQSAEPARYKLADAVRPAKNTIGWCLPRTAVRGAAA